MMTREDAHDEVLEDGDRWVFYHNFIDRIFNSLDDMICTNCRFLEVADNDSVYCLLIDVKAHGTHQLEGFGCNRFKPKEEK